LSSGTYRREIDEAFRARDSIDARRHRVVLRGNNLRRRTFRQVFPPVLRLDCAAFMRLLASSAAKQVGIFHRAVFEPKRFYLRRRARFVFFRAIAKLPQCAPDIPAPPSLRAQNVARAPPRKSESS
jgi:hypothetical protein